ncbi:MAG: pilus assembly protein PilM [Deltaproteobacteria bacterium]|jgi:type IV pilus assembly protein PilM|nr:pilus assembly protein PilM [Deltaproteobacteria bacterium]
MSVIGFDIGTFAAKALLLNLKGKGRSATVTLAGLGIAQLPVGVMNQWEEQPVPARNAMAAAMKAVAKSSKLGAGKFAALSMSGDTMIIKKITMPVTSQKELRASLALEAEQYIPYPINEVIIDGHILGTDDQTGQMSVLLVAARKDVVYGYIQALAFTKMLKPAVIDVDALAFFNAYDFLNPDSRENVILLDIGANLLHITILYEGVPHTIKEESIGGQRITDDLEEAFGVSPEEAEAIKLGALPVSNPYEVAEVVDRVVSNWEAAIDRALEGVRAEIPEYTPSRILVAGGSALFKGLAEEIGRRFQVSTEIFNPFAHVKFNPKKFDPAYLNYIGPQMAVSFGLAIRKVETL